MLRLTHIRASGARHFANPVSNYKGFDENGFYANNPSGNHAIVVQSI
jgi:hypothetical protein